VGKEVAEHRERSYVAGEQTGRDRVVTIIEATLLASVALLAVWSGYASAKWSTEFRLLLGEASTARDEANALFDEGAEAAETADRYVRITVFLATVLFLVGISGHFRVRAAIASPRPDRAGTNRIDRLVDVRGCRPTRAVPGHRPSRPTSSATSTASLREEAPSLRKIDTACVFTVLRDTISRSPMSP
jgi:hypothetical protein